MDMMKTIIAQLIDDFHERKRPALVARHKILCSTQSVEEGIPK